MWQPRCRSRCKRPRRRASAACSLSPYAPQPWAFRAVICDDHLARCVTFVAPSLWRGTKRCLVKGPGVCRTDCCHAGAAYVIGKERILVEVCQLGRLIRVHQTGILASRFILKTVAIVL